MSRRRPDPSLGRTLARLPRSGRSLRRGGWLILLLLLALVVVVVLRSSGKQPLELVFLDVDQGDATFLRTPDGKTALIDGGRSAARLERLLEQLEVSEFDLVIATHADFDHIGGLVRVLDDYPVRFFMDNGVPHTTKTYRTLLELVEASDAQYLRATERTIRLGDVELHILPPPLQNDEQNDNSIGVVVRYGNFEAVLPGDAPANEQAWWLEHYGDLLRDVEVYKAAHHGSSTGDRVEFLRWLDPEIVVVSAGHDNPYGHPHREAVAAYREVGATIYRTDEVGSITVLVPFGGQAGYRVRTGEVQPAQSSDVWAVLESLLTWLLGEL